MNKEELFTIVRDELQKQGRRFFIACNEIAKSNINLQGEEIHNIEYKLSFGVEEEANGKPKVPRTFSYNGDSWDKVHELFVSMYLPTLPQPIKEAEVGTAP